MYDKGGVLEYFYRSVMSYRPESDIKLLRFSLSGGYLIYITYSIYQKDINQRDVQSNLFLDSIEAQRSSYGTQKNKDRSVKSRSDYAYS